jgi:hypothetical protein
VLVLVMVLVQVQIVVEVLVERMQVVVWTPFVE